MIKLGTDGRYRITGLPPGEYFFAVVVSIDTRELADLATLESLIPASIKITLAEGEQKTADLRLGG